jgi:hypothetical protein
VGLEPWQGRKILHIVQLLLEMLLFVEVGPSNPQFATEGHDIHLSVEIFPIYALQIL